MLNNLFYFTNFSLLLLFVSELFCYPYFRNALQRYRVFSLVVHKTRKNFMKNSLFA